MVSAQDLKKVDLFKGLSDSQLGKIAELGEERHLEAGTICFSQGEKADKLHLCVSGTVDFSFWLQKPWGIDVTVHTSKDGEVFGWSALVEPYVYFNTARCAKNTVEIAIDRDKLLKLFREDPKTGYMVFNNLLVIMKFNLQEDQRKLGSILPPPVRQVSEATESEWARTFRPLVDEGESTNVVLKRQLDPSRDEETADFVRDILGLANTRTSGRRLLIIGFDSRTSSFTQSVNPDITRTSLEKIVDAYIEPALKINYQSIALASGTTGIIEVMRDGRSLPYRVRKDLGGEAGIKKGDIYVRHGGVTETPTPRELENLA